MPTDLNMDMSSSLTNVCLLSILNWQCSKETTQQCIESNECNNTPLYEEIPLYLFDNYICEPNSWHKYANY